MRSSWVMPFSIHLGMPGRSSSVGKAFSRLSDQNSSLPVGVGMGFFSGSL